MTAKSSTYHHGDLKNALVETALTMLEQAPLEALSLRKIAREVGVSPTAAYNHFANKEDLLASAKLEATKRFQQFAANVLASTDEPAGKIEAFSLGYFSFARQYPALFDIMLNCNVDVSRVVEDGMASVFAIELPLREAFSKLREQHGKPLLSEYTLSVLHQYAWSLTHGVIIHYRSGNFKVMTASGLWPEQLGLDHMAHALSLCKLYARMIADMVINAENIEPLESIDDWLAARSVLMSQGALKGVEQDQMQDAAQPDVASNVAPDVASDVASIELPREVQVCDAAAPAAEALVAQSCAPQAADIPLRQWVS